MNKLKKYLEIKNQINKYWIKDVYSEKLSPLKYRSHCVFNIILKYANEILAERRQEIDEDVIRYAIRERFFLINHSDTVKYLAEDIWAMRSNAEKLLYSMLECLD